MAIVSIKHLTLQIPPVVCTSVLLGTFLLGPAALGCAVSKAAQEVFRLRGKDYVDLPAGFCPGYSDTLLGKGKEYEYGGVVCDRTEGSYIFLQRLVGYTEERKAIWKVVQIKNLSQIKENERVVLKGCEHAKDPNKTVMAVIETSKAPNYRTLRAWSANLDRETVRPMQAKLAICREPLT